MDLDSIGLCTSAAASKIARACISEISGKRDPEPAAAMAEHWIELVQLMNAMGNLVNRYAELVRQFVLLRVIGGQKFVQRRIEKPNAWPAGLSAP